MVFGVDELMERIREAGRVGAASPKSLDPAPSLDEASALELARYLAVGLTMKGQAQLVRGVRRGFHLSLGTANWAFGYMDRATNNRLLRPVRQPLETRLKRFGRWTGSVIRHGQLEEQKSRLLAREAVVEIVDGVIEFLAENPEAAAWIQEVLAGQGVSLASAMRDNVRQLTVASDSMAEGMVRRILRRTPRQTLPPSPLVGKPQTMYDPETVGQMVEEHSD
jgi:hypothetical protein